MVGQLRLLAGCGADVTGVDVHPVFRALYSQPSDQGVIADAPGVRGRITLTHGHFPGDNDVRRAVGDGYDVFLSKNVLKRSYIHPEREVDERFQIKLGVSDEAFVKAMYDVLKPGGLALIYNIAPAQNPPDKPYLAHGRFAQLNSSGMVRHFEFGANTELKTSASTWQRTCFVNVRELLEAQLN